MDNEPLLNVLVTLQLYSYSVRWGWFRLAPSKQNVMLNLEEYEQIDPNTALTVEYLMRVHKKAGNPTRIDSQAAWRVVDAIFGVWTTNYPQEEKDFREALKTRRAYAKSVKKMVKEGHGVFTFSYPPHLYHLLKTLFPNQKLQDRSFIRKLANKYPGLKNIDANI